MTIDAASGATSANYASLIASSDADMAANKLANSATTSTSTSDTQASKDEFMKMLVAQLRYQDPSKPMDSSAFIAQTAQFSSLETLQSMQADNTSMLTAQLRLQAGTMVGETVSYTGADGKAVTGVVTSASFTATSVGGTGGEPVLTIDGKQQVVLSKVGGVQMAGQAATAITTAQSGSASTGTTASGTTASGTTASGTTASGTKPTA